MRPRLDRGLVLVTHLTSSASYIERAHCIRPWSGSARQEAKKLPSYYKRAPRRYDRLQTLQKQEAEDYYITAELARTLQRLGIQSVQMLAKLFNHQRSELMRCNVAHGAAIKLSTTSKQWLETYEEALTANEVEVMRDPDALAQIFHVFAKADAHPQNIQHRQKLGSYSMHVAYQAGDVEAGLQVALDEIRRPEGLARPTVEFLRPLALDGQNWRATTLYLWHVLQSGHTEAKAREHYLLARHLYDTVEPSDRLRQRVSPMEQFEAPWKLLHDAADHYLFHLEDDQRSDRVQADLDMALRVGVEEWKDPRAATLLLEQKDEVERHSARWTELTTQCAMAASENHCFELAVYHLQKDGWLSSAAASAATAPDAESEGANTHGMEKSKDDDRGAQKQEKPKNWVGIEWLALSAALALGSARNMTKRYLAVAHLLREHGHAEEGYSWLPVAKENLKESGLDPDDRMIDYLDGFQNHWYDDKLMVSTSEEFLDMKT